MRKVSGLISYSLTMRGTRAELIMAAKRPSVQTERMPHWRKLKLTWPKPVKYALLSIIGAGALPTLSMTDFSARSTKLQTLTSTLRCLLS